MQPIPNSIAAMATELTEWRRDLHRHPELGYQEMRTAGVVAEKLRQFGLDAVETGIGKTGVVGVLHGRDGPGEAILLRADMDALPILEETGSGHASVNPGVMHACGHDGHTTMLLGAAKHLAETRNFEGTVYFCFQPAEEGGAGAKAMIDDGLFDRFPARAVYGMHNWPGMPAGSFGVRPGPVMASADEFVIRIKGSGGHAAKPHLTRDPVLAGAQIVTALQSLVARRVDPLKPAVLSITMFQAGTACNVIPDEAVIGGTRRAFHADVEEMLRTETTRICEEVARAMGVSVEIDSESTPYPPTVNDAKQAAFAGDVLEEVFGTDAVDRSCEPTMGGEDFAFMAQEKPGAFVFIGNGDTAQVHTSRYDFNDEISPAGVAYWAKLVETALPVS
ncbi:MAG: M20 aminoacylase family protein [Pseudomonadota bacterium]